jgi:membrane protein DedA with SNARE-associated domain
MHPLAAAGPAISGGFGTYLALFFLVMLGWAGIPGLGGAVIGGAAVLASQGQLNIAAVLITGLIGVEAGGLAGYGVGVRWGRALLSHPGPLLARRQRALASGEALYAKWGRLAVFFTPCLISGIAKMKRSQFAVWNFLAGAAYVFSVGLTAYGAGKVSTGQQDPSGVGSLLAGIVAGVCVIMLGRRYYRRRKARRAGAGRHRRAAGPGTAAGPDTATADEES